MLLLREQYQYIKEARAVLLGYCETVRASDFVSEDSGFGAGASMRNLLVHVANCYHFWIGVCCLGQERNFTTYKDVTNVAQLRAVFTSIDHMMDDFFEHRHPNDDITYTIPHKTAVAKALQLYTHATTHEFHHKGQVLSISRMLGYTPADTDVMR